MNYLSNVITGKCQDKAIALTIGFLAVGLLEMRGIAGKSGWAWMFLIVSLSDRYPRLTSRKALAAVGSISGFALLTFSRHRYRVSFPSSAIAVGNKEQIPTERLLHR